nr:capsid protein [Tanacetum cinerariifolium]
VSFQLQLELNVICIGISGDGGYRYTLDSSNLQEFHQVGFSSLRPSCLETSEPLDIEHHMVFNVVADHH